MFERVGFIGLGRMGQRMAERLRDAGHPLVVFDVVPARSADLASRGAEVAASPREVAEATELVLTSVTDGAAVKSVLSGADGLIAGSRRGMLLIEMSTIGVQDSRDIAFSCETAGLRYVRSPVLGTLDAATEGTLNALLSGPQDAVDDALPLLAHLTSQHRYLGEGEEGRIVKLLINGMLAVTMASFAEVFTVGHKAGIDPDLLLDVISASGMGGPATRGAAEIVRKRKFDPRLSADLMLKDLRLLGDLAAETRSTIPVTGVAEQLFSATSAMGWGDLDRSAVVLVLEQLAGIEPRSHP